MLIMSRWSIFFIEKTTANLPVFVVEIVFVESANEFFVFLLNCLQIDIFSSRFIVRVEIIRKENTNVIETFHDIMSFVIIVTLPT